VKVIQPEPAPKTGDESHLIAWGVVAALSLIALVVISRKAGKEEAIE
jgi:LPXTG-motif cell wall-anchored protein